MNSHVKFLSETMIASSRFHRLLPPLFALIFSRALASLAAVSSGYSPWVSRSWIRWDSGHYLKIAQSGYELVSCKGIGYASSNDWCGNAGWFPGYPALIRVFARVFGHVEWIAVALPPVFLFLMEKRTPSMSAHRHTSGRKNFKNINRGW